MVGHRAEISKPEMGTVYIGIAANPPRIKPVQLILLTNSSGQMSQWYQCLLSFPPKPGLLAPKLIRLIFHGLNTQIQGLGSPSQGKGCSSTPEV